MSFFLNNKVQKRDKNLHKTDSVVSVVLYLDEIKIYKVFKFLNISQSYFHIQAHSTLFKQLLKHKNFEKLHDIKCVC